MYVTGDNVTYFDSFEIEHVPKKNKNSIGNKNIIADIYRLQTQDLIVFRYFSIGFTDLILKGRSSLDYANLFSPNKYEKNDKIIRKRSL